MSDLVTITGIAAGGDGVGRLSDGRAVFVPRTAPGDRIKLKDGSLKLSRTFGRAAVGEVAGAGPGRVALVGQDDRVGPAARPGHAYRCLAVFLGAAGALDLDCRHNQPTSRPTGDQKIMRNRRSEDQESFHWPINVLTPGLLFNS